MCNDQMIISSNIVIYFITVHVVLFTYCVSPNYFNCDLEENDIMVCKLPSNILPELNVSNASVRVPGNIFNLTKHLDIFACMANQTTVGMRLPIEIDSIDVFKRIPTLEILVMVGNRIHVSEELSSPEQVHMLRTGLFNLTKLEILAVSMAESTLEGNSSDHRHQWILPESLISLSVERIIAEYDLRPCSKLEKLSVRASNLTKLPPLHNPAPPIKLLRFVGCPLSELTVNDIAVFCKLETLTITSLEAPFNVDIEECECVRLKQWIDKLSEWNQLEFIGDLPCDVNRTAKLCLNRSLDEALRLRRSCLGSGVLIIYIAAAILALPVIFTCSVLIRSHRKIYAKPPNFVTSKSPDVSESEYSHHEDSSHYSPSEES